MNTLRKRAVVGLLCVAVASAATAQAPPLLNYQGHLTDAVGQPLVGNYTLAFAVYAAPCGTAPCGDSPVWGPATTVVAIVDGAFNVVLGNDIDGDPITVAFAGGTSRYMQVTVDGAMPILPRQQILSAPYAMRSGGGDHGALDGMLDDDHPQYLLDADINVVAVESLSANSGMYGNRIANTTPPLAYAEFCFKAGSTSFDVHAGSESTSGGNCAPGDIGWIIEKDERSSDSWANARAVCLRLGMRLPEPFEYQFSCFNSVAAGLVNMGNGGEWASNQAVPMDMSALSGVGVAAMGVSGCVVGSYVPIARSDGGWSGAAFRCAR